MKTSEQIINTITIVKYLGVYLNDSLTWETHFKNLTLKLNRAIGLLYYIKFILKAIHYSLLVDKFFMKARYRTNKSTIVPRVNKFRT